MTKKRVFKPYQMRQSELNEKIHELVKAAGPSVDADLLKEMIVTVLKMGEDELMRGDMKMINSAMKELRYGLKVFYPYVRSRKVAIFGSARTPKKSPDYQQAKAFAKAMVNEGWMVITGAASGIMQAGNEGAGRANSFGVNIRLPFEQDANPIILGDHKLINFKYFFTRKLIFVADSDATVLCPGGFGTHDEGFETLTLVQTGKAVSRPIVCLDPPGSGYWKGWLYFIKKQLAGHKMIDPDDLKLIHYTHDPLDAVRVIKEFYKNYHSQRYVGDLMVFRIRKPLTDKKMDQINTHYHDILKKGKIRQVMKPLEEEGNKTDTFHLTRLVFHFDRRHFARLKLLIDEINKD